MKEPEAEESYCRFLRGMNYFKILKTLREIPVPDGAVSEKRQLLVSRLGS